MSQMARLVDTLLDVSQLASGHLALRRQPVLLSTLLDAAIAANRGALDASRTVLRIDLPPTPITLDADGPRLTQVFSNLLNNAIKYTDTAGWIGISAVRSPLGDSRRPGVALTIADSGVGISAARLEHIFDLFTDDESPTRQRGLGMGLALARRLVAMHEGTIEAESEGLGQGSAFTIRLPLSTAVALPVVLPARTVAEMRRRVTA